MSRKFMAVLVAWGALGVAGFAASPAFAQSACAADADCAAGTVCAVVGQTGCVDTGCGNNGGCPAVPCTGEEIKSCVTPPCRDDSDCGGGMHCSLLTDDVLTCPTDAGTGGTGSLPNDCTETFVRGHCVYHGLGALPEGDAGSGGISDDVSAAGALDSVAGTPSIDPGNGVGSTTPTSSSAGATAASASPTATPSSGGCAVAFGAPNASSAGLLLFGLGLVGALRRRRAANATR